ncbi:hypothetical protein ACJX0J_005372, partial [Zea mays]
MVGNLVENISVFLQHNIFHDHFSKMVFIAEIDFVSQHERTKKKFNFLYEVTFLRLQIPFN